MLRIVFALVALGGGRMIAAAHHSAMASGGAPSAFRYVAIKVVAHRQLHNTASASAWLSANNMMQFSEVQFLASGGSTFAWPSGMTISNYTAYNGERHYSAPTLVSNYNSGESVGRLFDGSTSTKWGPYRTHGFNSTYANVYDYDTGAGLMVSGGTFDNTFYQTHFGTTNAPTPVALVLDLGASPLDISIYSRWQFLNANDNASQTNRTWIEGEILGSADFKAWWRLDVFNDPNIVNTNYAVARNAALVPRKGDLWSDLDLAERDWANGITVDGI